MAGPFEREPTAEEVKQILERMGLDPGLIGTSKIAPREGGLYEPGYVPPKEPISGSPRIVVDPNAIGGWRVKEAPAPTQDVGGGQSRDVNRILEEAQAGRKQPDPAQVAGALKAAGIPMTIGLGSSSRTTQVVPGALTPEEAAKLRAAGEERLTRAREVMGIPEFGARRAPPTPNEINTALTDAERQQLQQIEAEKQAATAGLEKEGPSGEVAAMMLGKKAETDKKAIIDSVNERLAAQPPTPAKGSQMDILDRTLKGIRDERAKNDELLKESGELKESNKLALERSNVALSNIEEKIRNGQIDPARFWTGGAPGAAGGVYSLFKGAFAALAVGLGAYAQGLSGGKIPNTAAQIIERALDRDMEAQKVNLQKLMAERGWAADQRNYFTNRFDAALRNEKANLLRQAELFVIERASESKKADIRLDFIKLQNEIENRAVLAEAQSKSKITTSKTSAGHQVLNPLYVAAITAAGKAPKEAKVEASVTDKLRSNLTIINKLAALKRQYDIANPSRFENVRNVESEAGAAFEKLLGTVIFDWVKVQSGAAFTDQEWARRKALLSPNKYQGWAPWKVAISSLYDEARLNAARIISQYPNTIKSAMPELDIPNIKRNPFEMTPMGGPPGGEPAK